jgi:hypothetical protein
MSVIGSNILAGASGQGGYFLTNSLRFRSSASAYLSRTVGTPTAQNTWTYSVWLKRGQLGISGNILSSNGTQVQTLFTSGDNFQFYVNNALNVFVTTQVFRDPSAWYHFVLAVNSSASGTNKVRLYVNGTEITAFSTDNRSSFSTSAINQATTINTIGNYGLGSNNYFDGYLAEANFIDGQQLTPSSFGSTNPATGVWQPIKYTGTYGTNGFYLPFTNTTSTTTLGYDSSPNGNNWTTNNISLTAGSTYDSMTDVPTLTSVTAANYAVINPLDYNSTYLTLSAANLQQTYAGVVAAAASRATMVIPTTGKYYWEVYINATGGGSGERIRVGVTRPTTAISGNSIDGSATSYLQMSNGQKRNNSTDSTYGSGFSATQIIQVLYDATAGAIYFGQNDSYANGSGSFNQTFSTATAAFTGLSGEFMPCFVTYGGADIAVNFGQRPFAYTPPSGFVALNTFNLPTPTIGATASTTANKYFDATTYTGNGSTQTITNAGSFQPDWVWLKSRSNATDNKLIDAVRGATKSLVSNSTAAEATDTNGLTAFNSNGFALGTDANYNGSTRTYVAWQWRASNATAVTNTAGSITSTVSANTSAGFSIVTYTGNSTSGATVGHGLNSPIKMLICKQRNGGTYGWNSWHTSLSEDYYISLSSTGGQDNSVFIWDTSGMTSTVFTHGSDTIYMNNSGSTYVAYCFAQVAGYSAMGSYTGNGSSDGVFVFTGFRPRFVMIKRTDSGNNWFILDTSRDTFNLANDQLLPNSSAAESTNTDCNIDILSNGFKLRTALDASNGSGGTYIYMAFAENPFKYSNAR